MSDMANRIGDVFIVCTKFDYTLLCTPNMGIVLKCSLYVKLWRINSLYTLLYTLRVGTAIGTIYTLVFDI